MRWTRVNKRIGYCFLDIRGDVANSEFYYESDGELELKIVKVVYSQSFNRYGHSYELKQVPMWILVTRKFHFIDCFTRFKHAKEYVEEMEQARV